MRFTHEWSGQRVVFGTGSARDEVARAVELLGATRVMLVASPSASARGIAETLTAGLPVVVRHEDVVMHVPVAVADNARRVAAQAEADALVCIGGGSATGLAKAVALTTGLPIVAVPTTYAGSEATSVWGLTENGTKTTGVDVAVLPRTVVYDARLTLSLPVATSVASGLNALAHCVDSMWAPRTDPIDQALAGEGIRALAGGLPAVASDPGGVPGREQALYGAYLAAVAFSSAGSGLHHKICHVLGGMFDLPHAQTHAVVLPHVLAFNLPNAPAAGERIAAALNAPDALAGLLDLYARLDAPRALRDYGLAETDLPAAVEAIVRIAPGGNPTPVDRDGMTQLLKAAWEGADPA